MVALPSTSPWADKYGAGPRVRLADVVDDEPGQIYDTIREGKSTWPGVCRLDRARLRYISTPKPETDA